MQPDTGFILSLLTSLIREIYYFLNIQPLQSGKNGKTDPLKTEESDPWKTVQTDHIKSAEIDHLKTLLIAPPRESIKMLFVRRVLNKKI